MAFFLISGLGFGNPAVESEVVILGGGRGFRLVFDVASLRAFEEVSWARTTEKIDWFCEFHTSTQVPSSDSSAAAWNWQSWMPRQTPQPPEVNSPKPRAQQIVSPKPETFKFWSPSHMTALGKPKSKAVVRHPNVYRSCFSHCHFLLKRWAPVYFSRLGKTLNPKPLNPKP